MPGNLHNSKGGPSGLVAFERGMSVISPRFRDLLNQNFSQCIRDVAVGPGLVVEARQNGVIFLRLSDEARDLSGGGGGGGTSSDRLVAAQPSGTSPGALNQVLFGDGQWLSGSVGTEGTSADVYTIHHIGPGTVSSTAQPISALSFNGSVLSLQANDLRFDSRGHFIEAAVGSTYTAQLTGVSVDVVTDVIWDSEAGQLKQTKTSVNVLASGASQTEVVDTAEDCDTTSNAESMSFMASGASQTVVMDTAEDYDTTSNAESMSFMGV